MGARPLPSLTFIVSTLLRGSLVVCSDLETISSKFDAIIILFKDVTRLDASLSIKVLTMHLCFPLTKKEVDMFKIIALITLSLSVLFCASAHAAQSMSYKELVSVGMGDKTPKSAFGKLVSVPKAKFTDIGYSAAVSDETTFVCNSGDDALVKHRLKVAAFEGVTKSAQGYEGSTVWSLVDCHLAKVSAGAVADSSIPPATPTRTKNKQMYSAGNKQWSGSVTVETVGTITNVSISTSSARGTCNTTGTSVFASPTKANYTDKEDSNCKAVLSFTEQGVSVKSTNCESMCGGSAPGIDYSYMLKK